jgi:hypothetical protein
LLACGSSECESNADSARRCDRSVFVLNLMEFRHLAGWTDRTGLGRH